MRQISGFVVDTYDDWDGRVLKSVIKDPSAIPDFVKTAHRLTEEEITRLPDDQFALVLLNEGRKMKKFAAVDKGNTAMSVLYLLKQAHLLPPEAVKTAASNLVAACQRFGLAIPAQLKIAAKTGISGVSGKSKKPYKDWAKVSKIQFPAILHDVRPESKTKQTLGGPGAAEPDGELVERTNYTGTPGENFVKVPPFPNEKQRPEMEKNAEYLTRKREWRTTPYVVVDGWEPEGREPEDHAPPENTLLNGHYPVDSFDLTKKAVNYFAENWKGFYPRDRHTYCVKLAARMTELGMEIPDQIERYGSETYAADVDQLLQFRRPLIDAELIPALETLIEKRSMIQPDTFAEAVAEFDKLADLNWWWDAKVPDPWFSTFGPSKEKIAMESWSWSGGGTLVTLENLEYLALNNKHIVKRQFGDEFMEKFSKNPVTVFEALPQPNKLVLARLASDRHPGTCSE